MGYKVVDCNRIMRNNAKKIIVRKYNNRVYKSLIKLDKLGEWDFNG